MFVADSCSNMITDLSLSYLFSQYSQFNQTYLFLLDIDVVL